jgi:hypothetical protein
MPALSGARPLEDRRQVEPPAGCEVGDGILLPAGFVEVDREEVTRLIRQQRVHARNERQSCGVLPCQMPADDVVGHRK